MDTPINIRARPDWERICCTMTISLGKMCYVLLLKGADVRCEMCWSESLKYGSIRRMRGSGCRVTGSYDYTGVANPVSNVAPGATVMVVQSI